MEDYINELYLEYQNKYKIKLPNITEIKFIENNNFWARILGEDMYKNDYILYVDKDLLKCNKNFIKQTLFHEFTHIQDSIKFNKTPFAYYKSIMASYSEFHAAKHEMMERLEEVQNQKINEETKITHTKTLTIRSFMEQSFLRMNSFLNSMAKNNNIKNFTYDTKHIYYYFGYFSAIKCFGINYEFKLYSINPHFYLVIKKIYDSVMTNKISFDNIVKTFNDLNDEIKLIYKINRITS